MLLAQQMAVDNMTIDELKIALLDAWTTVSTLTQENAAVGTRLITLENRLAELAQLARDQGSWLLSL